VPIEAVAERELAGHVAIDAVAHREVRTGQISRDELLEPAICAERERAGLRLVGCRNGEQADVALIVRGDLRGGRRANQACKHREERGTHGLHAISFRLGDRGLPNRISQKD
jgi:hypothetical protein